jgi:hypothetical protein
MRIPPLPLTAIGRSGTRRVWVRVELLHQNISYPCIHLHINKNIPGGNPGHPHHLNPNRSFLLRGHLLAVHFQDQAIRAVRSATWHCSRGPNRPFLHSSLTSSCFTDLWACIERGPVVSDLGYVAVRWCMQRAGWCGGSTVVFLARQGQNRNFPSHIGDERLWRGRSYARGDHGFTAGYGLLAPLAPLLVHAERRAASPSQIFLPFSSSPHLNLPCFSPQNPSRR